MGVSSSVWQLGGGPIVNCLDWNDMCCTTNVGIDFGSQSSKNILVESIINCQKVIKFRKTYTSAYKSLSQVDSITE